LMLGSQPERVATAMKGLLADEKLPLRQLGAVATGAATRSMAGLQRLLDTGLLAALFQLPKMPEKEEEAKGKGKSRERLSYKELQERRKAKQERDERDTRVAQDVAMAAVWAIQTGSKEQKVGVIDAGAADWLCAALQIEVLKSAKHASDAMRAGNMLEYAEYYDDEQVEALEREAADRKADACESHEHRG